MPSVPCTIQGVITWSGEEAPPVQPPLGIWGGAPLPVPTPPIHYPPQPPLGIWGGGNVPYPTPPIYYPPSPPLRIWGGGNVPYPTPPIHLPGPPSEPPAEGAGSDGGWAWSPYYGWVWIPSGGGGKPHPPQPPAEAPPVASQLPVLP